MPGFKTHFILGCAAGALVGIVSHKPQDNGEEPEVNWERILICTALGGVTGLLPDLIEPASSPWHRRLAHSAVVGVTLIASLRQIDGADDTAVTNATIMGYVSHLMADALTPRSLPIL